MSTAEASSFEVFRPLEGDDFLDPHFQKPLTELAHGFHAEVEAAALPAPEGATLATETTRLLQALDPAEGRYDYWASGDFSAAWESVVSVPIIKGDNPFDMHFTTRTKAFTVIDRSAHADPRLDDLYEACWVTMRKGMPPARKVPYKKATLLGVHGIRVKRLPARYEYADNDAIDRELRIALGGVMRAAKQVEVEASTSVNIHPHSAFILNAHRVLWLKTARHNNVDPEPATPVNEQLPRLRIVNELIARSMS